MIEEKIIIGENTNYPLEGIITFPDNLEKPVPAVVLVHGSGASDKDETVGKIKPFKDLAKGLANRGIASIRYDKRTFIHGKKMVKSIDVTVKEETIEDAIFATQLLKKDSRIDSDNIFIIGHSMGAMLAPRIDTEGGDYKGLILLAGSPKKLEEIMIDQNNELLKTTNKFLGWFIKKILSKLIIKFDNMYSMSDEEAKNTSVMFGNAAKLYYFKEMGEHPATDYLKNINKPMLIMQGDKDVQVSVEKDFNLYKELLKDNENVTFKLYENLNHAFMDSVYGELKKVMKEYKVEQHIKDYVIDDIANWIFETI
jgi:hypothetical protein